MPTKLSTVAKTAVLDGLPLVGGKPSLRFDSFTVEIEAGRATIAFSFAGEHMFTMSSEYYPGQVITVTGLDGSVEVRVSD